MKTIKLGILLLTALFLSCETDIPITDTTSPAFTFNITGDGFNRTFDQDTDFGNLQLNLRNGVSYEFSLTGTDEGGVELIQWQADMSGIIFETPVSPPWTARDLSPLSRMIEWRGDRNDPFTGSLITGRVRTNGQNVLPVFRFFVRDFGGERRVPNSSSGTLKLYIGNHATEVINL